jgi:hypothetical protein
MAGVAVDRALACDPTYRFAQLLEDGLTACLPPAAIRAVVADTLAEQENPAGVI